jgi:hypothetical protein
MRVTFQGMGPQTLIVLLKLAGREGGTSQAAAAAKLGAGFFAFQRAGGYVTSQSTSPAMIKLVMAAS